MSVLMQRPNGTWVLYCKGSDSVVLDRLRVATGSSRAAPVPGDDGGALASFMSQSTRMSASDSSSHRSFNSHGSGMNFPFRKEEA